MFVAKFQRRHLRHRRESKLGSAGPQTRNSAPNPNLSSPTSSPYHFPLPSSHHGQRLVSLHDRPLDPSTQSPREAIMSAEGTAPPAYGTEASSTNTAANSFQQGVVDSKVRAVASVLSLSTADLHSTVLEAPNDPFPCLTSQMPQRQSTPSRTIRSPKT